MTKPITQFHEEVCANISAISLLVCLGHLWGWLYSLKQPKTTLIKKMLSFTFVKSENISYNQLTTHPLQHHSVDGSLGQENRFRVNALAVFLLPHCDIFNKSICNFAFGQSKYGLTTPAAPLTQAYQCGFFYV